MTDRKMITDSLAGARITLDNKLCQLQHYNFVENQWFPQDEATWPLQRARAEEWLSSWNRADRFAAMNILTAPLYDFQG